MGLREYQPHVLTSKGAPIAGKPVSQLANVCVCVCRCVWENWRAIPRRTCCIAQDQVYRAASGCSSYRNQGKNDCVLLAKCTSVECCFALCWGCFWVSVRMHHGKSVWGMRCSCFSKDNFIYVTSDSTTYSWSLPAGLPVRTEILSQTPKIWIGKAPRVSFHDYFCFSFLLKWNWDLFNISLEKKNTHSDRSIAQQLELSQEMQRLQV